MIKNTLFLCALAASASAQTTFRVDVTSAADSIVFVQPGDTVFYEVNGALGGDPSQGLAMFAFDLTFDGGDLVQANAPSAGPLLQFVSPLGLNNPAGYGGTVRNGDLLQIGGAMNTIANTFAPAPTGSVITGIGATAPAELATGSVVAPAGAGTYTLSASGVFANALEALDPRGFWSVLPTEADASGDLTIVVLDCGAQTFCVGKENSAGCVPSISASGSASLGGASALTLTANDVVNGQIGLFAYGTTHDTAPLYGGTLCVGNPLTRVIEPGTSGGSGAPGSNCEGSYTRVLDAAFLANAGFGIGDQVFCQWVYRDPGHSDGSGAGLTDAAAFVVCP